MDQRVEVIRRKYEQLSPAMPELTRRLWAGAEAIAVGRGGVALVSIATGIARATIGRGKKEALAGVAGDVIRDRRRGAGRKPLEAKDPGLVSALEKLVDPATRGDPEAALRWTSKSTSTLAKELTNQGHPVSATKVRRILKDNGYTLQGTSRVKEGKSHPDRDAQFEYINARSKELMARGEPVISVDTKKKESIGEYSNAGREWQPKGDPVEVLTYDFADRAARKAIPYGVYDIADNKAFVNVGTNNDTAAFAVHSIERWWQRIGAERYPRAKELLITADSGGSNSRVSKLWKERLQNLADRIGLTIHVSHYPPGTSKWNKIEHRLFSFITMNWRGRPLVSYETVVSLISATTTRKGLSVIAELDEGKYPLGIAVKSHVMRSLDIVQAPLCGDWNYSLRPRTAAQVAAAAAEGSRLKATSRSPNRTRAFWLELFRAQRLSKLRPKQYCRKHGLNYNSFKTNHRRMLGPIRGPNRTKEEWHELFLAQRKSGLPASRYCRERGLNYATFKQARRRMIDLIQVRGRRTK